MMMRVRLGWMSGSYLSSLRMANCLSSSLTGQVSGRDGEVKEPVITLSKQDLGLQPESQDPASVPLSAPVSYYLDTHAVVLQLQDAGQGGTTQWIIIPAPPTLVPHTAGYTLKQAEGLVQVLCHTLQRAVIPMERSVLSQRDLVRHFDVKAS